MGSDDRQPKARGCPQAQVGNAGMYHPERVTPKLEQLATSLPRERHRKGLNPLRVAYYLADQLQRLGTEQAVAAAVGKTQPWVNQLLKLLKLTPELQALVQSGELNASVGRDLAKLSQPKQRAVLDTVASLSDTARERFWRTRGWLDTPGSAPGPAAGEVAQPPAHEPDNAAKPVAAKTTPHRPRPVPPNQRPFACESTRWRTWRPTSVSISMPSSSPPWSRSSSATGGAARPESPLLTNPTTEWAPNSCYELGAHWSFWRGSCVYDSGW